MFAMAVVLVELSIVVVTMFVEVSVVVASVVLVREIGMNVVRRSFVMFLSVVIVVDVVWKAVGIEFLVVV